MTAIVYVLAVFLFVIAFAATGLAHSCKRVLATTNSTLNILTDRNLDDEAKERVVQQAALQMLKQSILIAFKGAIVTGIAILPFWAADLIALATWEDTTKFALRSDVLAGTTLIGMAAWFVWKR